MLASACIAGIQQDFSAFGELANDSSHSPAIVDADSLRSEWEGNKARQTLALPQPEFRDSVRVDPLRLSFVGVTTATTVVLVHLYQKGAWWQGERQPFHFENDWVYALNIDKLGHMYGSYVIANVSKSALSWSGVNSRNSLVYGSLTGLAYQLYVELEDGFHKDYGFSPGDAMADIAGAMLPLAQAAFPVLQNVTLKWSYMPSKSYINALHSQKGRVFIDDYEGQTYWLSMDPHFLLSDGLSKSIPKWLGVSLGFGAHALDERGGGSRIYSFTLDCNFSKMETESSLLRGVFAALDFFHLPAPGISLQDGRVKVGIFYTHNAQFTL